MMNFPISSADCQLLMLLEAKGSVRLVAKVLRRDISVVTRQIGQIAELAPLVEKVDGKWQVSLLGKQLTSWARDAVLVQDALLRSQTLLRIATPREFATRVLAPQLDEIRANETQLLIEILSPSGSIESLLLKGEADVGLDCGFPNDPVVKFRRIALETFSIVASPKFLQSWPHASFSELLHTPHLQLQRLRASRLLRLQADALKSCALFHDISALRSACVAGHGWSILPTYTILHEKESGALVELSGDLFPKIEPECFGVWWLKERKEIGLWVEKLTNWLKKQRLS